MSALTQSRTSDFNSRVEDYLSDKLQTAADLESVDDLLARVRQQQEMLKTQLEQAKIEHAEAKAVAQNNIESLQAKTVVFQREQSDIDRRLQILTLSEVSDDAVRIFEARMSKLRRLDVAVGYVEILKEVESLSKDARTLLKKDPTAALACHKRLRALSNGLHAAQPAAEGAAPHLVDQVDRQVDSLYQELRRNLEADLQATLNTMAWPNKDIKLSDVIVKLWQEQVNYLLDLQDAEIGAQQLDRSFASPPQAVVLLPLQTMVQPLALRFQYHFYGDRPTNRLDKPEYFFSHILDQIEVHSPFMLSLLQPILDERIQRFDYLEGVYTDAVSAFITALLPIVSTKCLSLLPQIVSQPRLMSHFIHEMMSFDASLRDSWAYAPVPGVFTDWRGLTSEMLETHGYFSTWLQLEKDFALSRYKNIRDSAESGNIDFDGVESGRTKPTKGAIRVNDLLETITDRYRSLLSFSQKLKFLMDIQLSIFDDYHNYLRGALQSYQVGSHTAGRLMSGQSADEALGMKGLETLAKVFGSSEYLERKMLDWSDDVFFLELWDELQDRARRNEESRGYIGRDLSMDDVAAKTSSTIKTLHEDNDGGGLFDETATSYRTLRERAEVEIVRALNTNVSNAIRPFTRVSIWSSLSPISADFTSLSPSSALDNLLNTLSTLLGFQSKVLAIAPLQRISRQICSNIHKEIHDNIIMRNSFSAAGAAQLRRDVTAIEDAIYSSTHMGGEGHRNLKKLDQALTILNLPVKASSRHRGTDIEEEGAWGFDDEASEEHVMAVNGADTQTATQATTETSDDDDNQWGLWEAEKALFASNEAARKMLSDMQLDFLSVNEARSLITRRIEINS